MSNESTCDTNIDVMVLERICGNDRARRELLWLRAMEQGDRETIRYLESVDPDIESRIRVAHGNIHTLASYGDLWEACYERHAANAMSSERV